MLDGEPKLTSRKDSGPGIESNVCDLCLFDYPEFLDSGIFLILGGAGSQNSHHKSDSIDITAWVSICWSVMITIILLHEEKAPVLFKDDKVGWDKIF